MNELVFLETDDTNEGPFTTSNINRQGVVYVIEADGRIKIGRTTLQQLGEQTRILK